MFTNPKPERHRSCFQALAKDMLLRTDTSSPSAHGGLVKRYTNLHTDNDDVKESVKRSDVGLAATAFSSEISIQSLPQSVS